MCLRKEKASDFFQPLQVGVACASGTEKIIHELRRCVEDQWSDNDFAVIKIDMKNAFNLVFREALSECSSFFFQNFFPGQRGVMAPNLSCFTL